MRWKGTVLAVRAFEVGTGTGDMPLQWKPGLEMSHCCGTGLGRLEEEEEEEETHGMALREH